MEWEVFVQTASLCFHVELCPNARVRDEIVLRTVSTGLIEIADVRSRVAPPARRATWTPTCRATCSSIATHALNAPTDTIGILEHSHYSCIWKEWCHCISLITRPHCTKPSGRAAPLSSMLVVTTTIRLTTRLSLARLKPQHDEIRLMKQVARLLDNNEQQARVPQE